MLDEGIPAIPISTVNTISGHFVEGETNRKISERYRNRTLAMHARSKRRGLEKLVIEKYKEVIVRFPKYSNRQAAKEILAILKPEFELELKAIGPEKEERFEVWIGKYKRSVK